MRLIQQEKGAATALRPLKMDAVAVLGDRSGPNDGTGKRKATDDRVITEPEERE